MVERHRYWNLLDGIARLAPLDFYGGIIAGIGINILAALLITNVSDMSVEPVCALCMAVGFIAGGTFISIGRAILGEIRQSAQPAGGEGGYYDRFKSACNVKGHIAFGLFLIGILLSILLIALMILSVDSLILGQKCCAIL